MGSQPDDVRGPTKAEQGGPVTDAVQPAVEEAQPLRTMHDFWDLITGPEARPWSSLLLNSHLRGPYFVPGTPDEPHPKLSLFQACRGGRDMVLTTAKRATIYVRLHDPATAAGPVLRAALRALATRGKLRTTLHLSASDYDQGMQSLGALGQGTAWLDRLELCVRTGANAPPLPSTALAPIGRCCPNLRKLSVDVSDIGAALHGLDSPDHFPKLKELSIQSRQGLRGMHRVFQATGPHCIRQLAHLVVYWHGSPPCAASLLPPPGTPSPASPCAHLRILTLRTTLDDTLLGLLMQCAPALEQLCLCSMRLQSDAHVHTQTRWRQLQLQNDGELHLSSLACLPIVAPDLVITCVNVHSFGLICDITRPEQFAAARARPVYSEFAVRNLQSTMRFCKGDRVRDSDQPAALRNGLSLLQSWRLDDNGVSPRIALDGWRMSPGLMRELQQTLPRWQLLSFGSGMVWQLEPHTYAPLLRSLPDSYSHVVISVVNGGLTYQQVESICLGAPVDRTPEALLCVVLAGCVPEEVRRNLELLSIPNVEVRL